MEEVSAHPPQTEGARRLYAVVRSLLSPGIWLVLGVQMILILSLPGPLGDNASPAAALAALLIPTVALLVFFFLQAGAFHALTLSRQTLTIADMLRAGPKVFGAFVWLMLKALLLFVLTLNALILAIMLVSGLGFEPLMKRVAAYFNPLTGVIAYVFAYWLPYVFTQPEFRLLPSLQRALEIAWRRFAQSGFLALLILLPVALATLLPVGAPLWLQLALTLVSGLTGWIAYVYGVDVLRASASESGASFAR